MFFKQKLKIMLFILKLLNKNYLAVKNNNKYETYHKIWVLGHLIE